MRRGGVQNERADSGSARPIEKRQVGLGDRLGRMGGATDTTQDATCSKRVHALRQMCRGVGRWRDWGKGKVPRGPAGG
jgi:hypothetical protein